MGVWDIVSLMAGIVLILLLALLIYGFAATMLSMIFKGRDNKEEAKVYAESDWEEYLARYRKEWSKPEGKN
jgi:hypothetical protein